MPNRLTERQFQAHRLHQFRVEAELTIDEAADRAGIQAHRWWNIEYGNTGTVPQIKKLIALFVPGERRMQRDGE